MKDITNEEDVVKMRKVILTNSTKKTIVKKGNRRLHSLRFCAVCGRPLVVYNSEENKYTCVATHISCDTYGLFPSNICLNSRDCKSYISKKQKEADTE